MPSGKAGKGFEASRPLLDFDSAASWKAWLEQNRDRSEGAWLVFWKKASGKQRLTHRQALEESLCQGWIDSHVRKLDEGRYRVLFTPRHPGSIWSQVNLDLVRRLEREGRMTPAGRQVVDWSQDGQEERWANQTPQDLAAALHEAPQASQTFEALTPKQRMVHVYYVEEAKRQETRRKRIAHLVELLSQGRRLGQP